MAYTVEIPKREWFNYFEFLSERAQRHPIRLEVQSLDVGDQTLTRRMPLIGIDVETKGPGLGSIEVTVGSLYQEFMHHIADPSHIFLMMDDQGDIDCICIDAGPEGRTLLLFEGEERVPAWFHSESATAEEHTSGL